MGVYKSLFSMVLNMSMTGGIAIVSVMFVRLLLRRMPGKFKYLLWGVVLMRLLCPFSFSSVCSVFQMMNVPVSEQGSIEYIPLPDTQMMSDLSNLGMISAKGDKEYDNDMEAADSVTISSGEEKREQEHFAWELGDIFGIVWLLGVVVLWIYGFTSIIFLKRQLIGAVREEKNIYLCDYIETAFVLGAFWPRIYLPTKLKGVERDYILLHEKTHIRRGDHVFRLLAFLALSIHWFNPLVWCAFRLSERDMEMSCDEAVMRKMGMDLRVAYSASLLNMASGRQVFARVPLGFGEGNVKCRIKNILRYQKTATWVTVPILIAVALVFLVLGSNPAQFSGEGVDGEIEDSQKEGGASEFQYLSEREEEGGLQAGEENGFGILQENGERGDASSPEMQQILITRPTITDETIYGADAPKLDYVDNNTLIFHGNFGLFVYDRSGGRGFTGAIDLNVIGCGATQGDAYCEVKVSKDGRMVYLHPLNIEDMYVYDVLGNTLAMTKYNAAQVEMFDKLVATRECIDSKYFNGEVSEFCVQDQDGEYLYLECRGDGLVNDLYLVSRENDMETGFTKLFASYNEESQETSDFGYMDYTGYLDECLAWFSHERFQNQDYDGDGLTDRVYRICGENSDGKYRIEFGNGDVIETDWMGAGVPYVQTLDLNGDGNQEILVQMSFETSTNPRAFGAMALFEKKNGSYALLLPPEELRLWTEDNGISLPGEFQIPTPGIVLVYEVLDEAKMGVRVKGLENWINKEAAMDRETEGSYSEFYTGMERPSICYETVVVAQGNRDLLEYHFEVFNKWYMDEIVVTAEYEDGDLRIADCRYVSGD